MSDRSTIDNIQILRGLAALLVVLCHAVYSTWVSDPGFTLGGNLDNFGPVGVDLFIVISGFIIAHTSFVHGRRDPMDFARQRLWRVVPLYALLTAPWVVFAALAGPLDGHKLLATLTFWPATDRVSMAYLPVGWTLSFEMLFYAAATLCLLLPGRRTVAGLILAYLSCWAGALWTGAPALIFLGNPISGEFLMGVAIAHFARRRSPLLGAAALMIGLTTLAGQLINGYGWIHSAHLVLDGSQSLQRLILWGMPCGFIVLAAVLMEPWRPLALARPLVALGAASYSLYLVHPLVLFGWETVLQTTKIPLHSAAIYWAGVILSVGAGLLTYRLVERPLLNLVFRRRRPTPVAAVPT